MEIKILFKTSKRIHPKFQKISLGKYIIEPLPIHESGNITATNRYLLRFEDEIRTGESGSQPQAEAQLFLSYLSLILGSRLEIDSMMINSVNIPNRDQYTAYKEYERTLENLPELDLLLNKLRIKGTDVARQFLRACEVYRAAVTLIGQNNTFSFFLFTIVVECLSNKFGEGAGSCEKFIDFILKYLPDKTSLPSEEDWKELLKEVYYRHRSGFTHGGKEIPEAVDLADSLDRVYVRNVVDGKEVRTPGLKWFESVVKNSIIGFLMSSEGDSDKNIDHFKEISLDYGKVMLKAKRDLKAHTIVTSKDVNLD